MENKLCKCGHKDSEHSYATMPVEDMNLYCDKCSCKNFENNKI